MSNLKENIIKEKTFNFSLSVIELYKKMLEQNEYVLSKQLLRSATSIGANVNEATAAQSRKDFISKMSIASKEARETNYWLQLISASKIVNINVSTEVNSCNEIVRILTSIVKTSQDN
ncbi:MAG: four helix bundle protein [Bacteroidia bacterium]|nr:four helix bundle protein [Bacteroidia bacterium]MBP7262142.1 four helix bundle protein [Bacteroidia bacterium]MBP9180773.1 four helix bundle protein [Bacteroidia bacterium]